MHKKKTLLFSGSFLALLLIAIALLPSFFSTKMGKQTLLSLINRHLPGTVEVQSISLGWSGDQKIQGLLYKETDNNLQISCPEISCNSGLWQCLFSSDLGIIQMQSPTVEVQSHISTPIAPKKPQIQAASFLGSLPINSLLPHIAISKTCDFRIEQGKVSIFSDKTPSIVLNALTGHVLVQEKSLSGKIQANTEQKDLQGTIFIESNWTLDTSLEVKATLTHFPVEGADTLLSKAQPHYRGYLTDAIGPVLDLQCHIKIAQEECLATLQVQSANIEAHIQTELKENELTLSSPASLRVSLSPEFLEKAKKTHTYLQAIEFNAPFALSISLDQLHIPKTNTDIAFTEAAFEGRVETKPYLLSDLTLGCKGRFSSNLLSKEVFTHIDLQIQKKKETATSYVDVTLKEPLGPTKHAVASFHLGKTPTSFLQSLFPHTSFATDVLGNYIEATGSLERDALAIAFHSELLQAPKANFAWENDVFSLQEPIQIHYSISPASLSHFLPSSSIALQNSSSIEMTLSSLRYSSLQEMSMQAKIAASPLLFKNLFSLQNYEVNNFSCQIDIQSLSKISLQIKSDPFDLTFEGGANLSNHTVFWGKPLQARYTLSDQEMKLLYLGSTHPKLAQKTPCYLQIDPETVSWIAPSLDQMKFTAHLQIPTLSLQNTSGKEQVVIQNLQSSLELLGTQNTAKISLTSQIDQGTISCDATLQKIFSKDPKIDARIKMQQFPFQLINTAMPSITPLTPFLGSALDATLHIEADSQSQTCWIDAKNSLLQITGGLTIDRQGLFLTKAKTPLQVDFTLTPKAYESLAKYTNRPFYLEKNTVIKASISELKVPFLSPVSKTPDLKRLLIQAQIENQEISFKHKDTKKSLQLQNSKLFLQKKDEKTPLTLRLDTFAEGSQKGSLHIDAVCKQLLTPQGDFQLSHMHCDLNAAFKTFPSGALDIALPSNGKQKDPFVNLLGSSFDLSLKASLQDAAGPIQLQLKSPNVQFSLDGALKAGTLVLNQNMWLQCAITPATSRVLLQEVNPLSISSLSSTTPLTLEIASQGFSVPVSPFSLQNIQIPQGRITLGKLFCHNEGNLNLTLGLLKSQQIAQNDQLVLWFAPLDFHIKQGIVQVDRTEILIADIYDVALWGKIDLPGNRVNMNLGLTAPCLKAALNVRDLPADYVLHIPLTGTLDHVDLNKKVATSKIVALTLWQNKELAGSAAGGGFGGALVGGLLNQVLTPPGNDSPTPPAKHPFPWESKPK